MLPVDLSYHWELLFAHRVILTTDQAEIITVNSNQKLNSKSCLEIEHNLVTNFSEQQE